MTNIGLGQTINESLSSTDTKNPTLSSRFSDDYTLSGFSNWQQVEVNMNSTAINSYLQLVNASTGTVISDENKLIAANDYDYGNSKLTFTVFPGVNYAIRATSLKANETGNYTLKTSLSGTASSVINIEDTRLSTHIGTVDPLGNFASIVTTKKFEDTAISSNSQIFGIAYPRSDLYKIDPQSNSTSLVGNINIDQNIRWNSLEFAPNNLLYGLGYLTSNAAGDFDFGLYTIDPATAQGSLVAKFDPKLDISNLTFDPKRNQFIATGTVFGTSVVSQKGSLYSISLTGQITKIVDLDLKRTFNGDPGVRDLRGVYFDESNTLFGFNTFDNISLGRTQRVVINPVTGSVTPDEGLTFYRGFSVTGASSIPSATRTKTPPTVVTPTPTPPTVVTPPPTPPTVVTPTPTPPTVVTPIIRTPTPPTPNNTQQPSTNSSSISISSASDLEDGDQTLIPGGTIRVNGLGTGINTGSSNLSGFLSDNLKAFLGDIPIRLSGAISSFGSNPVNFDTKITLSNNISPGNYPLKLSLNTGTGSPISAVGPTFTIGMTPPIGSSLKTPFEIGKLSQSQDTFNFVDSTNTSDFFRFSLTNRSSFNLLLNPQNAGKPSGDAIVILRSNDGEIIQSGIQTGTTSFISRELKPNDYLIEVQRQPNARDEKIDYNLRTSAIAVTEAEEETVSLKSPSEITGFVTNNVNGDPFIDKTPKPNDSERLFVSISNRNGSPVTSIDPKKETWIVVHGNADSPKSAKMSALADAVAEYKKQKPNSEEPQVLVVDWSQPANNNEEAGISPNLAAEWINKVAEFAVHSLKDVWGISADKINLVGHSLGTFVSGLIGEKYLKYTKSKINKLILLDSARVLNRSGGDISIARQVLDAEDYDLDGSEPGTQIPPNFSQVATFSRSIWGDIFEGNGLGSPYYNETADESIKVEFKGSKSISEGRIEVSERFILGDGLTNHGDLVYLFSNILKSEDAIGSKLSLDAPLNKEWRNIPGGTEAILQAEKPGNLDANKNDKGAKAATLIAKNSNSSGNDDDIVYGTNENDTLDGFSFNIPALGIGASRGSLLYSEAGSDIFYGEGGDDQLFGGSGNDTIYAAQGNDFINGQQDNDSIFGGDDNDTIFGAKGEDTIDGGKGNDSLEGNDGKDTLIGGENNDTLWGGGDDSPDSLVGGEGNDYIRGEKGNDTILGDPGNDFINGEQDNDLIDGGDDNDTIFGAKGEDTIDGGKGNDSLEGNDGKDTLIGGDNDDTLWGGGDDSADSLVGGGGNDHIRGERGDDTLDGGKNNDSLEGNDGKDTLIGGDNDDTLWGGGDSSADSLEGGDGNDSLLGEGGDDILIGGKDKDTLTGGSGLDIFVIGKNDGIRIRDGISKEEIRNGIDLITDFDASGSVIIDKIKLIDLSFGDLDFQELERPFNIFNPLASTKDTAIRIKSTGEYLAFLDGVSKDSINKSEFFI